MTAIHRASHALAMGFRGTALSPGTLLVLVAACSNSQDDSRIAALEQRVRVDEQRIDNLGARVAQSPDWVRWHRPYSPPLPGVITGPAPLTPEAAFNDRDACATSVASIAVAANLPIPSSDPMVLVSPGRIDTYYCLPRSIDPREPAR